MREIWKSIEKYEGIYEVSNSGLVRSIDRYIKQRDRYGRIIKRFYPGTVLVQYKRRDNGMSVSLSKDNDKKNYPVHRLVAEAFIPNPDNKPEVNHKDRDRTNNHVSNLEWLTHQENVVHSFTVGTRVIVKGESNGRSKLKRHDVKKIRTRYKKEDTSLAKLGKEYGVNGCTIHAIIHKKIWRHI